MTLNRQDDDHLARLRSQDHGAFEELVAQESGHLLVVLRRMLKSEQDAEDCLQDVLLAAFRALPSFNGDSSVSTWLHRIAVNTGLMRLRSIRRRREELVDAQDFDRTPIERPANQGYLLWRPADPETALERREAEALLGWGLDCLSERHQLVIRLRDFENLSTAQAAARLGTSPDALKMSLHRARACLRDALLAA